MRAEELDEGCLRGNVLSPEMIIALFFTSATPCMRTIARSKCANFRFSTSCVTCLVDYVFCSNNSPLAVNLLPSGNFFLNFPFK